MQQIHAAFGRGGVAAILAARADNVEWEYNAFPNPVPWLQLLTGRAAVGGFFEALGAEQFNQFEPKHVLAAGNLVVTLSDVSFTAKTTGKTVVEPEEVHIWHFEDDFEDDFDDVGKVARKRYRADAWQRAQALRNN